MSLRFVFHAKMVRLEGSFDHGYKLGENYPKIYELPWLQEQINADANSVQGFV